MRIVAGEWGGRVIRAPKGTQTRPTSDRVREALFSALESRLGPGLADARVLDTFAGSGALGLEALSRGAVAATFVERDPAALRALRANIAALGAEDRANVVGGDVLLSGTRRRLPAEAFSLLFADPPYRIDAALVKGLLEGLADDGRLARGALVVWEHSGGARVCWPEGFGSHDERRYGDTAVSVAAYRGGSHLT